MPAWAAFWQTTTRFQKDKLNPWLALRNTLGVVLPLVGGIAFGLPSAGLAMSSGALNVAFRDSDAPYPQRAREMIAGSVVAGLAVFAGAVSGQNHVIAVIVASLWTFAVGMLVALSGSAADLGVMSLVMLLVYAAVPQAAGNAVHAGLLAFGGGLLQTLLALLFWPLRRYVPERRALGELYLELARSASQPAQSTQSPPATEHSLQAQNALATLDGDHSTESARFRLLLSQAERARLGLLTLSRLVVRLEREGPAACDPRILREYLELSSRALRSIGEFLLDAGPPPDASHLTELESLAERLRERRETRTPMSDAMVRDARSQMDALTGQLRSAMDLAASATPAGIEAFERREAEKPWTLRLRGELATLRANLSLNSTAFRHAIRLAACVALSDGIGRGLELHRSYWLPMTIAIVLKPDFTATFSRGVLRLAGTFTGLIFATALFHVLPPGRAGEVVAIAALMFIMRWLGGANYGILVIAVSGLVVFLIAMTGIAPKEVISARAINTAAGGAIALLAYWLWPTWERTRVSDAMARMLDSFREYFHVLRQDHPNPRELDQKRVAARLARSNLEASIDRAGTEPGGSAETVRSFEAMLAASHRLAHAMLALEAGLYTSAKATAGDTFQTFASDVELTLAFLAAGLRATSPPADTRPDLREDHHALVHSSPDRHSLVNVETDRITNSLNTLSEEITRWRGAVHTV